MPVQTIAVSSNGVKDTGMQEKGHTIERDLFTDAYTGISEEIVTVETENTPTEETETKINIETTDDTNEVTFTSSATSGQNTENNMEEDIPSICGSLASTTGDICRICHSEASTDEPLIEPCRCAGTLRFVHAKCLQKWIKSVDITTCELCKFPFVMTSRVKPLRKWQKLDLSSLERRKVLCSVAFHVIAITCVVWSLYVLIDRTSEEVHDGKLEWPFWTKLIVVAIGFTGGLVFMYVQCKMYLTLCKRWKAYNRIIYIQDCPPQACIALSEWNKTQAAAIQEATNALQARLNIELL